MASAAQVGQGTQNAARAASQSAASDGSSTVTTCSSTNQAPEVVLPPVLRAPIESTFGSPPGVPTGSPLRAPIESPPGSPTGSPLRAPIVSPTGPPSYSTPARAIDSRIDSFFQISKSAAPPPVPASGEKSRKKSKKSESKSFLWHVMDNAGIPMFFGEAGPELDPRLKRNYVDPRLPVVEAKGNARKSDFTQETNSVNSTQGETSCDSQQILHKIPEGQLDGTQVMPQSVKTEP